MKELIHTIVDVIRKNATVDWNRRDDVRAKLRLTVRKILMRYGYPPDMELKATETVIEQAKLMADQLSKVKEYNNDFSNDIGMAAEPVG